MKKSISTILIFIIVQNLFINRVSGFGPKNEKVEINFSSYVYDAIIVPGVPFNDTSMSKILFGRIYWSYYLFSKGITKNIIYSGSAVYTPFVEAKIMSLYANELGVPSDRIFLETRAEHSIENVYYSYLIAKKMGFKKVALATDPVQSRMMKRPSKKLKINIDFIPFSFDFLDSLNIEDIQIPSEEAYIENFVSIEERESFIKRFMGTIGKHIKFDE